MHCDRPLWCMKVSLKRACFCRYAHQDDSGLCTTLLLSEERHLIQRLLSCRLLSLKNTISKQLPNMPKEYIARLVMDRRHRSCAIVAKNGTVLGGITYRPFHAQVRFTSVSRVISAMWCNAVLLQLKIDMS